MKILLAIALMWGLTNEEITVKKRSVNAPVSIKLFDDNKALLRYKTTPESSVLVRIYDEDNRKYVKKQYLPKNQSFAKYYDFSKLGAGNYTVEVIERNRVQERIPVVIQPSSNMGDNLVTSLEKLNWNSYRLSLNHSDPLGLTVMAFQNGVLIHEEKVEATSFERMYKLIGVSPSHRVEFALVSDNGEVQWLKGN